VIEPSLNKQIDKPAHEKKETYLAYLAFRALLFGQDGCPTFAKAYVGRKRRAKPHHSLCHTGNK
jgi:hypothetical protein